MAADALCSTYVDAETGESLCTEGTTVDPIAACTGACSQEQCCPDGEKRSQCWLLLTTGSMVVTRGFFRCLHLTMTRVGASLCGTVFRMPRRCPDGVSDGSTSLPPGLYSVATEGDSAYDSPNTLDHGLGGQFLSLPSSTYSTDVLCSSYTCEMDGFELNPGTLEDFCEFFHCTDDQCCQQQEGEQRQLVFCLYRSSRCQAIGMATTTDTCGFCRSFASQTVTPVLESSAPMR